MAQAVKGQPSGPIRVLPKVRIFLFLNRLKKLDLHAIVTTPIRNTMQLENKVNDKCILGQMVHYYLTISS